MLEKSSVVFPDSFGFCGGVAAADELMRRVSEEAAIQGVAVFGLHEIVHNRDVVYEHENRGVTFVDSVEELPDSSAVVISAHGVGPETKKAIQDKGCEVFDATCPLVVHTHKGVHQARQNNEKVIYVCHGKPGETPKLHDEVAGTLGWLDFALAENGELEYAPVERAYLELNELLEGNDQAVLWENAKYRIITQTTLHADECLSYREEIKEYILDRQPNAHVAWSSRGDVCHAVADRQRGVEQLVELRPRRIVVATDPGSKNGMGYVKLAEELVGASETQVIAVANAEEAKALDHVEGLVGLTASASTPAKTIGEIAVSLGADNVPETSDGVFRLRDAKHISEKLQKLKK